MSDDQDWLELIQFEVPGPEFPTDVQAASNPLALPAHDCTQQSNSSVMQNRAPVLHPHQLHATNVPDVSSVGFTHAPRILTLENDISGSIAQFDPAMQHSNGPGKRRLETQESLSHTGYSESNPIRHINNVQTQPLMPHQSFGWPNHDSDLHNDFDPIHCLHGEPSLSGLIQSPHSGVAISDPTMTMSLRGLPPSMPDLDLLGMDASANFLDTPHNSYTSQVIPQDQTCSSVLKGPAALGNSAGIPGVSQGTAIEPHDDLSMYPIGNLYDTAPTLSTFSDNFDWFNWDPSALTSWTEDQSVNIDNLPSVAVPSQSLPNGPNKAYSQISTDMIFTVPHAIPSNANVAAPYGARPFENIDKVLNSQHLHTGSIGYAPTIGNGNAMIMYTPSPSSTHTYSYLPGNNKTASISNNLSSADKNSANVSMACVPSLPEQHTVQQQIVSRDKVRPASRKTTARSSKSVSRKRQLSLVHQPHTEKGVPEGLNFVMAFTCSDQSSTTGSSKKRRRTDEQRKDKSEVEQRGGSCMMCHYHHKKCSGQIPCNFCVDYWQRCVRASTNFRWTCDVRPRISGMKPFMLPTRGGIDFSAKNTARTKRLILETSFIEFITSTYKDVLALIDMVEPRLIRMIGRESKDSLLPISSLHSYCQSVLRWEPVLVRLAPHLRGDLGMLEFYYRAMHEFLQAFQDFVVLKMVPFLSVFYTAIFLEDVAHMDQLVFVDAAECKAAKDVLEKHLRFLLAQKFDLTKPWKKLNSGERLELGALNCSQSAVPCIVPRHIQPVAMEGWRDILGQESCHGEIKTDITRAQCIGRAPELDKMHREVHASLKTPSCFCGWIIACLPESLLSILGLDADSLSRLSHDKSHVCYAFQEVFAPIVRRSRSDNEFLASTTATEFRYSIRLTVAKCFREMQSPNAPALANEQWLFRILRESLLLMLKFILVCTQEEAASSTRYKHVKEKHGTLFVLRNLARMIYGKKIMEGLW